MSTSTFLRTGYNGANVTNDTVATGGDGTNQGGNTGALGVYTISGGSWVWKDDTRFGGARSIRLTNTAGQGAFARFPLPSSTYTPGLAFDLELPALADAANTPITFGSIRNGAGVIQLRLTSAGLLDLLTGPSGSQVSAAVPKKTDGTATMSPLAAGGLYRIEVWSTGSSASVGTATVTAAVFAYGADKLTYLGKTVAAAATLGTNPFTASDVGMFQYGTSRTFSISNVRVTDTASDFMGPNVNTNQPPILSLPANRSVAAGAVVTTTATASDPDGTISSYAWSLVAPSDTVTINNASSATCTLTAGPAGSLHVLQCVVTDSGGLTATAQTEVRVETSGDAFPLDNEAASGWVRTGGTSDGGVLADSDNGTYLESPNALSATPQRLRRRVRPITTRSGLSVPVSLRKNGPGTATATITLQQGTVDKGSLGSITVTDTWAEYTLTLTTEQVNSITDRGNLFIVVDGVS